MKSFNEFIPEEFVEVSKRKSLIVFKNPTSREYKEYIESMDTIFDFAGFLHKNDLYLFLDTKDMMAYHAHVMKWLGIKDGNSTVSFRVDKGNAKNGTIVSFAMGGTDGGSLRRNKKDYKKWVKNWVKLYKHKSLKPYIKSNMSIALDDAIAWEGEEAFVDATGVKL